MDSATLPRRSATVGTTATTATTATSNTTNTGRTSMSDEEAIPDSDLSGATTLLLERLQAWKHMCGYLENYVTATHKVQKSQSKEFEKILKTVSEPLKEGHHFDMGKSGVAGLFENLKNNTQGIANLHLETEKNLKTIVLPILERLHSEIKTKSKELRTGASKTTKLVTKARSTTQKHIELLGQYAASFDSATRGKIEPSNDPYILARGVNHRLNKQIAEENNNLQEILAIQNSFQQFEAHILETVQNALNQFFQCMGAQTDRQRAMYADMVGTAQQIPTDFEWANFFERNDASLINPNTPPRTMSNINFPNQDHRATQPLVAGFLDRKSRTMVKGYSAGYYVVSPTGYLHGFKDNDDFAHDPSPDISLYLPDCSVGNIDGLKFSVKGKDVSSGKVGNAFHMNTELNFKAHSKNDVENWLGVLTSSVNRAGSGSSPTSPIPSRNVSAAHSKPPTDGSPLSPASPAAVESEHKQEQEQGVVSPQTEGTVNSAASEKK